jgi:hypothetical protein
MKRTLIPGLIGLSTILAGEPKADMLGDENDVYFGLQVTIPLETNSTGVFSRQNRYSLLLVEQADGIRKGLAYTRQGNGARELSYLKPTQEFKIGYSRISEHSLPLMRVDADGNVDTGNRANMGLLEFGLTLVVGAIVIGDALGDTIEDIIDDDESEETE